MNSKTVDLIATDPPFNKGKDFHATPDSVAKGASFQDRWSWDKDVHESWVDKITDDFPDVMNVINGSRNSYGDDMGAFLCFMGVRMLEMHRILKTTGSMYLHCDPTASHYLKELMDAIFGYKNFLNEIVWCYKSGGVSKKWFAKKHDIILFYAKNRDKHTFNVQKIKSYGQTGGGQFGKVVYYKDEKGSYSIVSALDWWNISMLATTHGERLGYPTQKPLELYERMIKASSNEKDTVLDPFCGCATTCVAAEKLNRQWVGIDIWDKAHKVVIERLKKEGYLADTDEEREDLIHTKGTITYSKKPFIRTDGGSEAVPFLEIKMKMVDDTEHDPFSNKEKKQRLVEQQGSICQGCGIALHERYMELDHQLPRADGGSNLLSNRILLCSPCNKLKRHLYTISWLRNENKKLGYMINENALFNLKQ